MMTAVNLDQHSLLGHSVPPDPVLGWAAAGTGQAGPGQDPAHRLAAEICAFQFPQQLGEVGVISPGVASLGQSHHDSRGCIGNGVGGTSSPVPVGQCRGALFAIGCQDAPGMTFGHPQNFSCLGNRKLVFQNTVQHVKSCLL